MELHHCLIIQEGSSCIFPNTLYKPPPHTPQYPMQFKLPTRAGGFIKLIRSWISACLRLHVWYSYTRHFWMVQLYWSSYLSHIKNTLKLFLRSDQHRTWVQSPQPYTLTPHTPSHITHPHTSHLVRVDPLGNALRGRGIQPLIKSGRREAEFL